MYSMEDAGWPTESEFYRLSISQNNPLNDDVSPCLVEAATSQGQIGHSAERESPSSRIHACSQQPGENDCLQPLIELVVKQVTGVNRDVLVGCSQHEPASRHDKFLETAFQPSALEGSGVTTSCESTHCSDDRNAIPRILYCSPLLFSLFFCKGVHDLGCLLPRRRYSSRADVFCCHLSSR